MDRHPKKGHFGAENLRYAEKTVHPGDLDSFNALFSREAMLRLFGEGKKQITKRLRRMTESGDYHMVEFMASHITQQCADECWCVLVSRDVHEDYQQEQQINLEIGQLATVARVAYQMLISVNLTQNTYYMMEYDRFQTKVARESGVFDELIAVGASTVAPEHRAEFVRKFSRQSLLDAFARGERSVSLEVRQLGDDGVYHWNYTQVVRVDSPYTDDVLEITLSKCIDEERRQQEESLEKERKAKQLLEDALRKAEKASQAKSDFLSRISHDIRTPMNAIIGMTELAQRSLHDMEKLTDYLKKIENAGAHLLGLINEVLDMSKIESGTIALQETEFDLRDLIQEAVMMVQPVVLQREQSLYVEVQEGLHGQVYGDEQRLRQVLTNLLDNASKYTEARGTIRLTLEETQKGEVQAGTYRLTVSDNGIGMEPSYIAHIFEPFSRAEDSRTAKIPGTGLGMTIVQNVLAMMGGSIEVESEYGTGSRFIVTLRLLRTASAAPRRQTHTAAAQTCFPGMRVLLAEDNPLNQQIAVEMLQLLDVSVYIVENGEQAVEAVLKQPPFYYDAVLMDIQMPVMDGYEAARRICGAQIPAVGELPIFALPADAFAEDARQARLAGMDGHLAKPVSIEQLRNTLATCVEWRHQHDPQMYTEPPSEDVQK